MKKKIAKEIIITFFGGGMSLLSIFLFHALMTDWKTTSLVILAIAYWMSIIWALAELDK